MYQPPTFILLDYSIIGLVCGKPCPWWQANIVGVENLVHDDKQILWVWKTLPMMTSKYCGFSVQEQ